MAAYDLIIDATPVGMFDEMSILTTQHIAQIPETTIVIDLKYTKKNHTINGLNATTCTSV